MIAGRRKDRTEASRGFALLVVLWFLVLIAAIGTYLMANARSETAIARNILAAAHAEALADAGVAQAAFNLTETLASNR
jgi:Tfp pilus assembly protein PilX